MSKPVVKSEEMSLASLFDDTPPFSNFFFSKSTWKIKQGWNERKERFNLNYSIRFKFSRVTVLPFRIFRKQTKDSPDSPHRKLRKVKEVKKVEIKKNVKLWKF